LENNTIKLEDEISAILTLISNAIKDVEMISKNIYVLTKQPSNADVVVMMSKSNLFVITNIPITKPIPKTSANKIIFVSITHHTAEAIVESISDYTRGILNEKGSDNWEDDLKNMTKTSDQSTCNYCMLAFE
jgi:hypothetical protein